MSDGSIKCWGWNNSGQIGVGHTNRVGDNVGEMGDYLIPAILGESFDVVECFDYSPSSSPTLSPSIYTYPNIPCKSDFSSQFSQCALFSNQQMKCWGWNTYGQLGQGTSTTIGDLPNQMGTNLSFVNMTQISRVSGGYASVCTLSLDFNVKCFGYGLYGQLGYGNTDNLGDSVGEIEILKIVEFGTGVIPRDVVSGFLARCIISMSNDVKCWGYNNIGQLGLGSTNYMGNEVFEMGDYLPFVDLGTGLKASQVQFGETHVCSLMTIGGMKCWGQNNRGQLGLEDVYARGDDLVEMGDNLPFLNLGSGVVISSLASASSFNCVLFDNSQLKCFGSNSYGQLGYGYTPDRGDGINEMGDNLQFLNMGTGRIVIDFDLGIGFCCAILDDFSTKCWGLNSFGQLGYGDMSDRGNDANEMGDYLEVVDLGNGKTAETINLGDFHSCAVLNDNSMKCWGRNNYGQLGQGHTNTTGDDPGEMGNSLPSIELGGLDIQVCFDYSPTLEPSVSISPTFTPTTSPTYSPSLSFSPSVFPSTLSPSISIQPSLSPTLGAHLLGGIENGTVFIDEIYGIGVDSQNNIIIGGQSYGSLFGYSNKGDTDMYVAKYTNMTLVWGWMNGSSDLILGLGTF